MSSRKRARTVATTPTTEPTSPKLVISGGIACQPGVVSLWRQCKLLDCTVTAGGSDFEAHRNILAGGSAFFNGAFTSGMAEAGTALVTLPEVSAAAFEAVLSFLYTGEAAVAEAELATIFTAAAYLQIPSLVESVAARLEVCLTSQSCLETWSLAETYGHTHLAAAAKEAALRHFEALAQCQMWLGAPLTHVRELVSDDRLETTAEEALHTAVVRWAHAQRPPPTDADLLPLFRSIRYSLFDTAFFEAHVLTEPLLQGAMGIQIASVMVQPARRRLGLGPRRVAMKWSLVSKSPGVKISADGKTATGTSTPFENAGDAVISAEPLPATGKHLVEVKMLNNQIAIGDSLGWAQMVGVVSAAAASAARRTDLDAPNSLSCMDSGFWGVDDSGGAELRPAITGIRRGAGGEEKAPEEARAVTYRGGGQAVFVSGDRVGLVVDMDKRTLTLLRNGEPIPSLVFDNLPDEVYVAATAFRSRSSATFVEED